MRTTEKISTKEADVGFRYLLVSLFLAVLAFFIVLNSISRMSEVKTDEFFDQVQEEFVGENLLNKFKLKKNKQSRSGGANKTINIRDVIHDFLINNSVLVISDFTDYGKVIEIKITTGAAFNTESDYPKASATKFLREFSEMVKEQRKVHNFDIALLMGYIEDDEAERKLTLSRLNNLSEKIKFNVKNSVTYNAYVIPYNKGDNQLNFIKLLIYVKN